MLYNNYSFSLFNSNYCEYYHSFIAQILALLFAISNVTVTYIDFS